MVRCMVERVVTGPVGNGSGCDGWTARRVIPDTASARTVDLSGTLRDVQDKAPPEPVAVLNRAGFPRTPPPRKSTDSDEHAFRRLRTGVRSSTAGNRPRWRGTRDRRIGAVDSHRNGRANGVTRPDRPAEHFPLVVTSAVDGTGRPGNRKTGITAVPGAPVPLPSGADRL